MTNDDPIPAQTVPIGEVPLPEVTTSQELMEQLARVLNDGLPGFVIRSTGLTDIKADSQAKVSQAVADALSVVDPTNVLIGRTVNKYVIGHTYPLVKVVGTGNLHFDHGGLDGVFNVHRTDQGSGKALLANTGRLGSRLTMRRNISGLWDPAHNQLIKGVVDPDIIEPVVHYAHFGEGDSIIFPFDRGRTDVHGHGGPIWHRFDTSSNRMSSTTDIKQKQ